MKRKISDAEGKNQRPRLDEPHLPPDILLLIAEFASPRCCSSAEYTRLCLVSPVFRYALQRLHESEHRKSCCCRCAPDTDEAVMSRAFLNHGHDSDESFARSQCLVVSLAKYDATGPYPCEENDGGCDVAEKRSRNTLGSAIVHRMPKTMAVMLASGWDYMGDETFHLIIDAIERNSTECLEVLLATKPRLHESTWEDILVTARHHGGQRLAIVSAHTPQ